MAYMSNYIPHKNVEYDYLSIMISDELVQRLLLESIFDDRSVL